MIIIIISRLTQDIAIIIVLRSTQDIMIITMLKLFLQYYNNELKAIHIMSKSIRYDITVIGTYLFNKSNCLLLIIAASFDS